MTDALGETFLSVQRAAWDVRVEDPAALAARLRAIAGDARAAWPGVEVPLPAFVSYVAERAPDQTEPLAALAEMHTSDLYLACACAMGSAKALACFEAIVLPAAEKAVARVDRDPEWIRQVVHEVRVKLLAASDASPPRIAAYLGRGPLTSWVQVVAMREAYSAKRVKPAEVPEDADVLAGIAFEGEDAELAQIRAQFSGPFKRAFGEALAGLDARERNVLRLYLLEDVSSEAIGRIYRVHRATVARWIARIHETVLSETKKRLARELGLSHRDVDSFVRLLSSKLEVSIATALRA